MATYNIHAGHAAVGHGAIGAVGVLNESVEDRRIKNIVIKYLKNDGHIVYDCTHDDGTASQVLSNIVKKCNAHNVDLDVSIHFNAGANRPYKDGVTTGTEVYVYDTNSTNAVKAAERIVSKLSSLGFKNRGVKTRRDLYFLSHAKAQSLLIEVCFVDDGDDAALYNANVEKIGKCIAEAIMNKSVKKPTQVTKPKDVSHGVYRLYNSKSGEHLYTISAQERDKLIDSGWGYEGVGWKAPIVGTGVVRLYDAGTNTHIYTADLSEVANLRKAGWKNEGTAFFSGGKTKVYRLCKGSEHFFTASKVERDNLKSLGWKAEGVAFYGE